MKINQHSVSTLGVGHGKDAMARLGLWPDEETEQHYDACSPRFYVEDSKRRRRRDEEAVLLALMH